MRGFMEHDAADRSAESAMNSATSSAAEPVTTNTFLQPADAVTSSITLASRSAFLDTKLRMDPTREEHVKDATIKGTMGFAMRLRIAVPDYEVNGQLWRINHYEGSALYDQDLVFLAFEDGPGNWGVAWGVNRPDSGSDDLEVVRAPAADATAEDGETAFRHVQDGALQFWLPIQNRASPTFRAWLRLTARVTSSLA